MPVDVTHVPAVARDHRARRDHPRMTPGYLHPIYKPFARRPAVLTISSILWLDFL